MPNARAIPPGFDLAPIDDVARDGHFQLVFGGNCFAVVRWRDQWEFGNGIPLDFEPEAYRVDSDV
jgi:hypothetical protein